MTGHRAAAAGLLFVCACGLNEAPSVSLPLQAEGTAEMLLGPGGTYGYGSTIRLTIRLTNPDDDTAWVHVAEDANGPVGAILYDDDARTTVVQEVFTNSYYRPDDLVEPARHPIPPGQSREWTSTFGIEHFGGFLSAVRANAEGRYGLALELVGDTIRVPAAPLTIDAGLGRLLTETTIAVTGSGASQTLQSETHLRNISSDPVTISYLPDFCNVQLRGYATADRSGPPAWKTGGELCGYRGEGDRIEPGEVSFAPQRSVPDIIDELLGTAPRQHYYVSFVITLNGFRIERPAGEVDLTPP